MLTRGAVLHEVGAQWQVEEIEVADPAAGEVQVRLAASGLCHSDEHLVTGATPVPLPVLGGHEGAGVITKVGPGVRGLAEGDHVVLAFLPACGTCRPCASGLQNLCDRGAELRASQTVPRATTRDGQPLMRMCMLGTFAPHVTVDEAAVIKIEHDVPLELILPVLYQTNVGALSIEFANPRHQHEYAAIRANRPPENKIGRAHV